MSIKTIVKLTGKVALVTGASRGIGAAIAKRLAADGASVAITYSKGADAAAAVVKAIEEAGGKALAIQADAIDAKAVKAAVEKTVATFGKLDVLVNNAGTAIPKPFEEATLEELDRVIDLNLRGVFVATQAALKHIGEGGRIIMIGHAWASVTLRPAWLLTRPRRARSKCSRKVWRVRSGVKKLRSIMFNPVPSIRI
jgi:3-oxoacyl-[acyl-carrier protein] reductase